MTYDKGKAYHYSMADGKAVKGKQYDGKNSFISRAVKDLNAVSAAGGAKRVNALVNSQKQYSLDQAANLDGTQYDPKSRTISYTQNGGEIADEVPTHSVFKLGHEVAHASDDESGLLGDPYNLNDRAESEKRAVSFENTLRANMGKK